jgi:hypothetical protein
MSATIPRPLLDASRDPTTDTPTSSPARSLPFPNRTGGICSINLSANGYRRYRNVSSSKSAARPGRVGDAPYLTYTEQSVVGGAPVTKRGNNGACIANYSYGRSVQVRP